MGIVSVSGSPRCRYIALDPCRLCAWVLASALLPLLLVAVVSAARAEKGFLRLNTVPEDAREIHPGIFPGGSQFI